MTTIHVTVGGREAVALRPLVKIRLQQRKHHKCLEEKHVHTAWNTNIKCFFVANCSLLAGAIKLKVRFPSFMTTIDGEAYQYRINV